jgi:hypothetical protein
MRKSKLKKLFWRMGARDMESALCAYDNRGQAVRRFSSQNECEAAVLDHNEMIHTAIANVQPTKASVIESTFVAPTTSCDGCGATFPVVDEESLTSPLAYDLETDSLRCANCSIGRVSRKLLTHYPGPSKRQDPLWLHQFAERMRKKHSVEARHAYLLATDPDYVIWFKKKQASRPRKVNV